MKIVLIALIGIVVTALAFIYFQNAQEPELGVSDAGQFKPLDNKPNSVSTQAEDESKRVEPLPFKSSLEDTISALEQAVQEYGGGKVTQKEAKYLRILFTTPTMKFNDDAEFYLDTDQKLVHFRSKSRAGYSDMGLNRSRYNQLKAIYMKQP